MKLEGTQRSVGRRGHGLSWAVLFAALGVSGRLPAQPQTVAEALQAGNAAMRAGEFPQAVALFQTVTRLQPSMAEGHLDLGLALEQQGDYPAAVAELQTAARLKPTLRGADLFLGIAEYRMNAPDKAEPALQREVKLSPRDAKAWMWLGVAQMALDRNDEAVIALDKAAALDPKDPDILYHRGRAHLLVSKASYERMFALEPDSYRVHEVLAQAAEESQQPADAIAEYQQAIARASTHAGLHEELGDLQWAAGATKEADAAYTEELRLDPYSVTSAYKLGCLRETLGDAQGAVPLLKKALLADPSLEHGYYCLGRAQLDLGDDAAGLLNLERASKARDDIALNTLAYYQLARVYRHLHRLAEADAALAQFRALRAESERLDAEKSAKRAASHQLPRQEAVPAEDAPQ